MYSIYFFIGAICAASAIALYGILQLEISYQNSKNKHSNEKTIYPLNGSVKIITKEHRN